MSEILFVMLKSQTCEVLTKGLSMVQVEPRFLPHRPSLARACLKSVLEALKPTPFWRAFNVKMTLEYRGFVPLVPCRSSHHEN